MVLNRLREITESIIRLDTTIGFWRVVKYVFLGLIVLAICNFKTVIKTGVEFVEEISDEIHDEKMEKRDELLTELLPILKEYRASVGADRLLYFEYHNSKENLVGIPFKYVDIVLQDTKYGISTETEADYQDINVGAITPLYEDIKLGDLVYCTGPDDIKFITKYRGTYDIFNKKTEDQERKQQAFISIPGIKQPVGLIVLEWINSDESINKTEVLKQTCQFRPRINALIMSKK